MCTKLPCPCSCEMNPVDSIEAVYDGPPGSWFIGVMDHDMHPAIWLRMPFGNNGTVLNLGIYAVGQTKAREPSWSFDGNRARPTLGPSIACRTSRRDKQTNKMVPVEEWHGYVQDGVMMSCQQMAHIQQVRRGG